MELIFPAIEMKQAALDYRQEHFDNGEEIIHGDAGLDEAQTYEEWLEKIQNDLTRDEGGFVPATVYFGVIKGRIAGTIQIRHKLNEHLLKTGGHIGYGVRPSERRKGYATKMLALALEKCRDLSINKALVTCDKDNLGSLKTIENNGGLFEDEFVAEDGNITLRYWISVKK